MKIELTTNDVLSLQRILALTQNHSTLNHNPYQVVFKHRVLLNCESTEAVQSDNLGLNPCTDN